MLMPSNLCGVVRFDAVEMTASTNLRALVRLEESSLSVVSF